MHFAVTAVGTDQPGIVAAVTEALYEVGANLEDSRMALLGGHFALVVIVALPEGRTPDALREALREAQARFSLTLNVGPISAAGAQSREAEPWVVSVYGADKPGIVAGVSRVLADGGANITDLATHVAGEPAVYVMVIEATLSPNADPDRLQAALRTLGDELGVDVAMHPMEPETL